MKIYITRQSTSSIHAGGLERLQVWFQKPLFYHRELLPSDIEQVPFGDVKEGFGSFGWMHGEDHNNPQESISFGKMFGYGSELHNGYIEGFSDYVWSKLNDHYGNTSFCNGWYKYEKQGKCRQQDFLLEIDLKISWETPKKQLQ